MTYGERIAIKSRRELERMRDAGLHTGEILMLLREAAKPGVNGWSNENLTGVSPWTQVTTRSNSPTHSWFVPDIDSVSRLTDAYFVKTKETVRRFGDKTVTYAVFRASRRQMSRRRFSITNFGRLR